MRRRATPGALACVLIAGAATVRCGAQPAPPPDVRAVLESLGPDTALWYQHVQTLSNPWFEGRADGSAGIERAREYAEFYFRAYGLEPAFTTDGVPGYRQPFSFVGRRRMEVNVRAAQADLGDRPLVEERDFVVMGTSSSGTVRGPVAFVGYGIASNPDGDYTSFDDATPIDGHIALLLRYEPVDDAGASRWAARREPGHFSPLASLERKMRTVVHRGAIGILLTVPPGIAGAATGFEPVEGSAQFGPEIGVPVIQISPEVASELLARSENPSRSLLDWRRAADDGRVRTVALGPSEIELTVEIDRAVIPQQIPAANLGAILRGTGALSDQWLVIGGHYDHNGYGSFGTTPESGPLFPGADDNASGTAGVLVLAKRLSETLAARDDRPRRSILFMLFDAEERGLFGSEHWANHPSIDPSQVEACLNMDMIGRVRHDRITVLGAGTAVEFSEMLARHDVHNPLHVIAVAAGSGASDDANFHRIGIPALHFFSGLHAEYTSPRDLGWTVDPVGARSVLELVEALALELLERGDRLTPEGLPARP